MLGDFSGGRLSGETRLEAGSWGVSGVSRPPPLSRPGGNGNGPSSWGAALWPPRDVAPSTSVLGTKEGRAVCTLGELISARYKRTKPQEENWPQGAGTLPA